MNLHRNSKIGCTFNSREYETEFMGAFRITGKPDSDGMLFQAASVYPIVALRVAFGFSMVLWAVMMMFSGRVADIYSPEHIHIPYRGLEWVQSLPVWAMHLVFLGIAVSALGVGAGWFYRRSGIAFLLLFAYAALIDQASYLSYYYFVLLLALMLLLSPAHRNFSIDLIRKPNIRIDYIPRWLLLAFQIQVAMVFIFAGMAKLNADWMLNGAQMQLWINDSLLRFGLDLSFPAWLPLTLSWMLLLFDFIIPHFLFDQRTSYKAFWVVLIVQLCGLIFLPTGIFPFIMILACTVFLPADRLHNAFSRVSYFLYDVFEFKGDVFQPGGNFMLQFRTKLLFPAMALAFLGIQVVAPVSMYLQMGSVRWANSAFHFSSEMPLITPFENLQFFSKNVATGQVHRIDVEEFLSPEQKKRLNSDLSLVNGFITQLREKPELGLNRPEILIEAKRCSLLNSGEKACETLAVHPFDNVEVASAFPAK